MSKETAIMAVVEEIETNVSMAEVPLATDEGIKMDEIMGVIVAHLEEAMVAAMDFRSNLNTRPTQVNQCAIDVVWAIIGLRLVGLPSILLISIKRV